MGRRVANAGALIRQSSAGCGLFDPQKKPATAGFFVPNRHCDGGEGSGQVCADQFGHFEHGDLVLAKDHAQLGICIDVALVRSILQVVLFDVLPNLFGDFRAGHRGRTNHSSQVSAGLHGLHECGVGFAFGFCCHCKLFLVYLS